MHLLPARAAIQRAPAAALEHRALRRRERGRAPQLDLLSSPLLAADLPYRLFGETPDDHAPVRQLSNAVVAGGVAATIVLGLLACWLRYRRLEAFPVNGEPRVVADAVSKWFGPLVAVSELPAAAVLATTTVVLPGPSSPASPSSPPSSSCPPRSACSPTRGS